ncbi:hypothetical protein NXV19_12565 [Bacteroides fragilis]|nr:hypothetical protein NXV19_12565 [Bacteroides fragilis]
MKKTIWNNEELILALDLYFQIEYGQMDGRNPQVKALSEILTLMHESDGFSRSVNSVSLKLANFKRIDPEFKGKGMTGGGKSLKNASGMSILIINSCFIPRPKKSERKY